MVLAAEPGPRPSAQVGGGEGADLTHGVVELAVRLGGDVRVTPACCSIAVGDEVMALERDSGMRVDLQDLIAAERTRPRATGKLAGIPIVTV